MERDEAPPPMSEAVLDENELAALLGDIAAFSVVDEIIVKAGPGMVGAGDAPALDEVHALLVGRTVRGVQIRYRHDGAHWWDTLMVVPEGVRLVRVRHDF